MTAPLSYAQEGIWYEALLRPASRRFELTGARRLAGPVDAGRLAAALDAVAQRHEVLRTTFGGDPPRQFVHPRLPPGDGPFEPVRGPLYRARLLRDDVAQLTAHHLVADELSLRLWLDEVAAVLRGDSLPPLPLQYREWAARERLWVAEPQQQPRCAYWQQRLADAPPATVLAPGRAATDATAVVQLPLEAPLVERLQALAREQGATLFAAGLALFADIVARRVARDVVVVGTISAGRALPELERLIGCFANIVPLRLETDPSDSLADRIDRAHRARTDALSHELPFAKVVELLQPPRDPGRPPVAQLGYRLAPARDFPRGPLAGGFVGPAPPSSPFELELVLDARGITLVYRDDLFPRTVVARLARELADLAEAASRRPEAALRTLAPAQRPASRRPTPATLTLVPDAIATQAERAPDAVAVRCGERSLTYAALLARADALAARLRALGVARETLVGVSVERSTDLVVALLGVLRAGGAFVPLDSGYPTERLRMMAEDAGIRHVVGTSPDGLAVEPVPVDGGDAARAQASIAAGDAAYVMFTSGSTGRPKGVVVEHRSLASTFAALRDELGLGPDDVLLAITPVSFDISILELLLPLVVGGQVVVAPRAAARDGTALLALALESGATVLQATPAGWRLLVDADRDCALDLKVLCGGDALPPDLAAELRRRGPAQWNLYGPTEATIWASALRLHEQTYDRVLIGRPLANASFHVLDEELRPVPARTSGELFIGGSGVARGYLGNAELTAERFVDGGRLYRTGDLVRELPGGLEFLGRIGNQLKIRGFRIEPAEIELALTADPSVREAVVVGRETSGGTALVAYVVGKVDVRRLRARLERTLPDYMIPSAFVPLDELPLTPNGKLDRKALPPPEPAREEPYEPPLSATEQAVAAIWSELLELDAIGANDDFFALGGHSALAASVVARARDQFDVDLPLLLLFEEPTVRGMAERIESELGAVVT